MAGILDMFDSPDMLSSLFGIGGGEAQQAQDARNVGAMRVQNAVQRPPLNDFVPPMPPQTAPDFGPSGADPNAAKPDFVGGIGSDAARAPNQPGIMPGPMPGGIGSDAARTPGVPQPSWQNAQAAAAPVPPIGISSAPAPIPPMPPPGAEPPTMGGGGGLPGAFGLDPNRIAQIQAQQKLRAGMAGVGAGLSAVGHLPPGASKGQALAAGAGGSLSGQAASEQHQDETRFNQLSTGWKDMLAAQAAGDPYGVKHAQAEMFLQRAEALKKMTEQGGPGSRAMLNTLEGKVAHVESQALKYRDQLRKSMELDAKNTGSKFDHETLNKETEAERQRLYKQFGIDPGRAEKLKSRGTERANPFPAPKTEKEFDASVPLGSWYDSGKKYGPDGTYSGTRPDGTPFMHKGEAGKPVILQRLIGPPGSSENAAPPAQGTAAMTKSFDDEDRTDEANAA